MSEPQPLPATGRLPFPRISLAAMFRRSAPSVSGDASATLMPGYLRSKDEDSRWRRPIRYALTFWAIVFYGFFILLIPRQLMLLFLMPVLILFAMVVWAMPVTNKAPPKTVETLFWLYFGSLFLWPNYLAITIPGLPWITIARLLGVPLMMLLIWCASTSQPFKDQMRRGREAMPAMVYMVFAFSILQFISIGFSDSVFVTINRVFNNMLTWTVIFFAAIWVFRDPGKIHKWIIGYLVMTAILCLMAIAESYNGGVLWAKSLPGFLKPDDPLVDQILAGSYRLTGQYRVQATQTTPLSLAEMLALAIPLMFYVADKYRTFWVIVGVLALEALIITTLLLADARLGFVALLLGHLLALLYFGLRQWRASRASLIGPAITMLYPMMLLAVILAVAFVGRIRVRVLGSGQHQGSNDAREEQTRLAFQKIWESPLFGFGADRGGEKLGYFSPGGQLTIDSYYLSILMDYGFIGFFLFYGMFVYGMVKAIRAIRSNIDPQVRVLYAVFGIFLAEFLVIKSVLSQAANHPLIFMAFGALVALAAADRPKPTVIPR